MRGQSAFASATLRVGASLAGIRLATLALRFALTIYVTAAIGVAEVGVLGLVAGIVAFAPALLGKGLSFHLSRTLARSDTTERIVALRERLTDRVLVLLAATALATLALPLLEPGQARLAIMGMVILWGEAIGLDLYIALSALHANVFANLSVAMRTAAWVPFAIIAGLIDPAWRSIDAVLAIWCAGEVLNLLLCWWWLQRSRFREAWRSTPPSGWVRATRRQGLRIWPSDIALTLIVFAERFVLSPQVSAYALGVYTFYWTFANAAHALVQSSILAPALPRLVRKFDISPSGWREEVRRLAPLAAASVTMMSGAGIAVIWIGHAFVPQLDFPWAPAIGGGIFLAAILRLTGDFYSMALNSCGAERDYANLNIGYAVCTTLAAASGAFAGGLGGAIAGSVAASALFAVLRARAVDRVGRGASPHPAPSSR